MEKQGESDPLLETLENAEILEIFLYVKRPFCNDPFSVLASVRRALNPVFLNPVF